MALWVQLPLSPVAISRPTGGNNYPRSTALTLKGSLHSALTFVNNPFINFLLFAGAISFLQGL